MEVKPVEKFLPGVLLFEPDVFEDERGFFLETYHSKKYCDAGIEKAFLQDNHSHSCRATLRGLHYQLNRPQGKLIYVVVGEIFDVAVDIRLGSSTFGRWTGTLLSEKNKRQMFSPEGFAHGFCVLSEKAHVIYKCTDLYTPGDEYGILWSDPDLDIDWPIDSPMLSDKDGKNPQLKDIPKHSLPVFGSDEHEKKRKQR